MVIIQLTLTQHMVIIMDIHIGIINKKAFSQVKTKMLFYYSVLVLSTGCSIR